MLSVGGNKTQSKYLKALFLSPGRCHLSTLSTSPSSAPLRVSQLTNLQVLTELQGLAWAVEKDLVGEFIIKLVEFRPGPWTGGLRHTAAVEWLGETVTDKDSNALVFVMSVFMMTTCSRLSRFSEEDPRIGFGSSGDSGGQSLRSSSSLLIISCFLSLLFASFLTITSARTDSHRTEHTRLPITKARINHL